MNHHVKLCPCHECEFESTDYNFLVLDQEQLDVLKKIEAHSVKRKKEIQALFFSLKCQQELALLKLKEDFLASEFADVANQSQLLCQFYNSLTICQLEYMKAYFEQSHFLSNHSSSADV